MSKNKKKYRFDIFSIRVVMQIIKYLVQLARELGQGQTDRHTDIHRTDQRLKTYTFFFILYFYFFIGGLKDTNYLTHAQGVNSQCQPILNRQKNKCMFAAIETINQYPDTSRSRFQNKPSTFQFLICVLFSLVKKTISIDVKQKLENWTLVVW